ncbi:MAG: efflux RND transporter periplasmic adaptor subunit [Limisphaerales bacterium]
MTSSDQPLAGPNQANRHTRRWLPYAGALLLAGLIVGGLWPQPVPVETARISTGVLRATVNEEGKTRIKHRYVLSAPVAGQLRRIDLKAGAEVEAGQTVLAILDPQPPTMLDARARALAEFRRDAAAARLEKDRTAQTFAASELRRFEKLYANQTVSIQEREAAQSRADSALQQTASAQSALREAEAELAEFSLGLPSATNAFCLPRELKAPASGRVLRVFEENARVVSAGTPLLEVGDPSDLEVVIEVLSRDGAAILPGNRVEFEQWGAADKPELLGRVRLVEPAAFTKTSALGVDEQRVNVVTDLLTPPERRPTLGDNFRVEAKIVVWETNAALKVPAGALFRQGDQWSTFVLADGRAQLRPVKIGRSSSAEIQVLDGLKDGEQVILYPGSRVRPGQRVKPIRI